MKKKATQFLKPIDSERKIERLAWQIFEDHSSEKELMIIGISDRGSRLCQRLGAHLRDISPLKIYCGRLDLDKKAPLDDTMRLQMELDDLKDKCVVLVDDVLNSGKTLAFAVRYIMGQDLKSLRTCVLVDREHHSFPVKADYVGISLSTTLQEHVTVKVGEKEISAFLE
jgi:pyrimidine operon attenuation protein/uracil phosphoribosyltransferase